MRPADRIGIGVVHPDQACGREAARNEPGGAAGVGRLAASLDLCAEIGRQQGMPRHGTQKAVARRLRLSVRGGGTGERRERQDTRSEAGENSSRGGRCGQ